MDTKIGESTWPAVLTDPSERRSAKPRTTGLTMVIDKGMGPAAFADLLTLAGDYIDLVKFGFGTAPLHPLPLLREKIAAARRYGIATFPGGTLLEAAIRHRAEKGFFDMAQEIGFDAVEVSDGTIDLDRGTRDRLIRQAGRLGLRVFTEYGKKTPGSRIDADDLCRTVEEDCGCGAEMVTVEARESGVGVGLYDENGNCREEELDELLRLLPDPSRVLWEAPHKNQQVALLMRAGADVNLGNVPPSEAMALETMRRGLRSDTFALHRCVIDYEI
ncbi:phosphosulfolactate synthase [Cohnella zeiphila]|uniref:Phosphosulfolactate synthase n=1 Tax=Cohnella zeiphila TaxID=2761120 RepID=A0A7X0SID5_9BACL|nr:phosphosulfolactate synthase [Cohnella zeiphila]MBB6730535.1 phosphosulfolactate synthase [Cohnella zeiphila]